MKTGRSLKTSRLEHVALAGTLAALLALPSPTAAQTVTMRQYQFGVVDDEVKLVMTEVAQPVPGANEVLVRVRATSLNRRDLSILQSQYGGGNPRTGLVPLSDGAGEVNRSRTWCHPFPGRGSRGRAATSDTSRPTGHCDNGLRLSGGGATLH